MAGEVKKVLIIVYYWPPSGGSGVQRWVKLTKYLSEAGLQVHVLTVDEHYASYMQTDPSLCTEVSENVNVAKTRSFEIINLFAKIFGKKKVPTAGFYNLDRKSLIHNLGLIVRSNLFIPDPRRGWNSFAYKKACEIIKKEGITTVITSTPPHSSQLIGLKLKKKLGIQWIADLRDPWTDIFYYKILRHSFISRRIDASYERKVLVSADRIMTVSQHLKSIFSAKDPRIDPDKILIIPNGYDEEDFARTSPYKDCGKFTIGYTGTLTDQYEPWAFLRAFRQFIDQAGENILLELTGTISPGIINYIEKLELKDHVRIYPPVDHKEIPGLISGYSVLLLFIPRVENAGLILTGKLFEYLAARRPILLIGPKNGDAEKILTECSAGLSLSWESEKNIKMSLVELKQKHDKGTAELPANENLEKYSRRKQAEKIKELLESL